MKAIRLSHSKPALYSMNSRTLFPGKQFVHNDSSTILICCSCSASRFPIILCKEMPVRLLLLNRWAVSFVTVRFLTYLPDNQLAQGSNTGQSRYANSIACSGQTPLDIIRLGTAGGVIICV